jgi:group I intron endonuclease
MNILEKHTKFKRGELSKKSGVYIITNTNNNKIYIGETTNLESRFTEHLYRLLSKRHVNNHLQNAVNLYGIETFGFDVLEFCDSIDTKKREHYWVTCLHALDKVKGYNIKPTDPNKINLRSEETSRKIYETKKKKAEERGYWHSKEAIEKRIATRKGYTHSKETREKIGKMSLGRKIHKSEEWKYQMSELAKINHWGGSKKKVIQFTKLGEFVKEWESITEASNFGFTMSAIIEVCKNKPHRKTHKGYVWKYKEM